MKERGAEPGEVIYREGDAADALYVVREGEVEVLRSAGSAQVRLNVLRAGALFGEMGVIRDKPRSTMVRALGPVRLLTIPKDAFLASFHRENPLALALLQTLCERLVQADAQLLHQRLYSEGARVDEVGRIRLLGASPEVESQVGTDGIEVSDLPFRVGRHSLTGDRTGGEKAELMLHAASSGHLSPLQFAVEAHDGRLVARDLESHLGTLVNGARVAFFEASNAADLHFGENLVQAGGSESPYRFRIIVERAA